MNRASCDITIGTAIGAGMDVDYDQPTYPDTPALAFAASGSARTSAATTASTSPARHAWRQPLVAPAFSGSGADRVAAAVPVRFRRARLAAAGRDTAEAETIEAPIRQAVA